MSDPYFQSRFAQRIGGADPTRLEAILRDAQALAEAGLAEMRALIFELRPEFLSQEGLVAALQRQVAAVRARHQLSITLNAFSANATVSSSPGIPLP